LLAAPQVPASLPVAGHSDAIALAKVAGSPFTIDAVVPMGGEVPGTSGREREGQEIQPGLVVGLLNGLLGDGIVIGPEDGLGGEAVGLGVSADVAGEGEGEGLN